MAQQSANKLNRKRISILALAVAIVLIVAAGAVYVERHSKAVNLTVKPSPTPTLQGPAKTGSAPAGPEAAGATPSATPTAISNPNNPVSSTLAAPTGDLLNVRCVALSKAGATKACPNTNMNSTCQSVVGASCSIQATMSGATPVVVGADQTITDNGTDTVPWNWDANKLTPGTWTVEAVATLNGQTATSDPETLTVTN
jgi:hypothetical protein